MCYGQSIISHTSNFQQSFHHIYKIMESLIAVQGQKEDPNHWKTMRRELERWSASHGISSWITEAERRQNAETSLSQLGIDITMDPARHNMLARQVVRWSWEVQSVQGCGPKLHLPYHPIRTAWLWMEEYGPDLWPADEKKRGHLDNWAQDTDSSFVHLRDRAEIQHQDIEQRVDIIENIPQFCFSKGTLHPYNSMFQQVLQYFAGVYAGLWDGVDYKTCENQTAAQLMAQFLGMKPWVPEQAYLPLFYNIDEDFESDCGRSCCSDCSTCSYVSSEAGVVLRRRSTSSVSLVYLSAREMQLEELPSKAHWTC